MRNLVKSMLEKFQPAVCSNFHYINTLFPCADIYCKLCQKFLAWKYLRISASICLCTTKFGSWWHGKFPIKATTVENFEIFFGLNWKYLMAASNFIMGLGGLWVDQLGLNEGSKSVVGKFSVLSGIFSTTVEFFQQQLIYRSEKVNCCWKKSSVVGNTY